MTEALERSDGEGDIRSAETLARWLDDRFLDPLLGFALPGVGDVVGSALGLYVVVVAFKRRLPLVTVARMLLNLGIDALVGAVPIAGDLFDFAWKANRRNVRLLRARHEARRDTAGDWLRVVGAFALLIAALAVPVAAAWWIVQHLVALWH
ncbi:MAG: DUF4112 domain-containing protein [Polyangia bacterium]